MTEKFHRFSDSLTVEWLLPQLTGRSARDIALDMMQLIRDGEIPVGSGLPPVRELARAAGVSPGTVSAAWRQLRGRGLIAGSGRAGITVVDATLSPRPVRFESQSQHSTRVTRDLGYSAPDPELLADVYAAIARTRSDRLNTYDRSPITDRLERVLRAQWPYPPREFFVANGAYDALRIVLQTNLEPGDRVIVETPAPPRMMDLLELSGARPLLLGRDEHGPRPDQLTSLLARRPKALLIQAGLHNPQGTRMTAARRTELNRVIADSGLLVIEDDGSEALWQGDSAPLAAVYRGPHYYIRSYSKSHGPDLRIGVTEGTAPEIRRAHSYFGYGAGWTSRILQDALASLLTDDTAQQQIARARETYRSRRRALARALSERGIPHSEGEGFELLVPVRDENYAQGVLESAGIAVSCGTQFTADYATAKRASAHDSARASHWLRVSASQLPESAAAEVAAAFVAAIR